MSGPWRRWGGRAIGLGLTGFGLYIVAPSVVSLLGQWPDLRAVRPFWFVLVALIEAAAWVCLWFLVITVLPGAHFRTVASAQLAGNAVGFTLPGGAATGSVVQGSMLVRAGQLPGTVAAALGSVGLLTTGMLLALP